MSINVIYQQGFSTSEQERKEKKDTQKLEQTLVSHL